MLEIETNRLSSPIGRLVQRMRRSFSIQWWLVPAICGLIGLFFAISNYVIKTRMGRPTSWTEMLKGEVLFWVIWAALSPLILLMAQRFRFERPRVMRSLLMHLLLSVLFAVLSIGFYLLVDQLAIAHGFDLTQLFLLGPNIILYWIILAINLALYYQRQYGIEVVKASRLHAQLAEARLQALQMQLHPHFLFNTMHSITALILQKDDRGAISMVRRLSDFLRITIESADVQLVPLKNELEFTERYLEIEHIRFQDRLTVTMDIDPRALDAEVPNMILQPLVENAVRHGIALQSTASRIQIRAQLQDGHVRLEVCDDGRGLMSNGGEICGRGVGLKNTRERLSQHYGEDYHFSLLPGENGGAVSTVVLPFKRISDSNGEVR